MNTAPIEKSFCTTREAANLLGVSVGTVQLWVESGLLDAWKTAGGHRRVIRDSVERLLHKVPTELMLPSTAAQAPHLPAPVAPRRLSILVVEDDANLLRLYQAKLSSWSLGAQVTTTDNAFAALLMLGRVSPDLLITDLHMPGMDGFEMLKVIRRAPEVAQTTIVVVSGLDTAAIDSRGGLPAGVEVLTKPIPFDRLQQIAIAVATDKRLSQHPLKG
jgi:excisionase family DNA binding protein